MMACGAIVPTITGLVRCSSQKAPGANAGSCSSDGGCSRTGAVASLALYIVAKVSSACSSGALANEIALGSNNSPFQSWPYADGKPARKGLQKGLSSLSQRPGEEPNGSDTRFLTSW